MRKSLVSIDDLTTADIKEIFKYATSFSKNPQSNHLKGKIISLLFFEPSSRTFSSFSAAVKRSGGQTIEYQNPGETSSLKKGETFEDMIKVFGVYSDAIVMRHPVAGSAKVASDVAGTQIINAGDGVGEHPTQALLDGFTIFSKHKKINNLKGLIVGDLKNGRTVHSLLRLFSKFKNNEIWLLSIKGLSMEPTELESYKQKGLKINLIYKETDIPKDLDFWYWTRIQTERLGNKKIKNTFILRNELIHKSAGKRTLFMHPLPRVGEISEEVDSDPRAMYLSEQLKNGVYVRMAIFKWIFK